MTPRLKTTIQIDFETKKFLQKYGRKGETYDEIILRLIKNYEKRMFMEEQYKILDASEDWISLDELK